MNLGGLQGDQELIKANGLSGVKHQPSQVRGGRRGGGGGGEGWRGGPPLGKHAMDHGEK